MSAQPLYAEPQIAVPSTGPALQVMPIPALEPPPLSSQELADLTSQEPVAESRYRQGALDVDFSFHCDDPLFAPQPTSSAHLPPAQQWSRQALRVMLEVMEGTRPARQLTRWVNHPIQERLARRGVVARQRNNRHPRPNLVRSVHVCHPSDGVAEVAALVVHQGRHRALAMRLTGVDGRWLVTALEIG